MPGEPGGGGALARYAAEIEHLRAEARAVGLTEEAISRAEDRARREMYTTTAEALRDAINAVARNQKLARSPMSGGTWGPQVQPTIASDEDFAVGFMLADHAPTDPDERLELFVKLAAVEWDQHFDPAKLGVGKLPRPFTDDAEGCHATTEGERPDSHWYVFTDLPEAQLTACGYCGQFGTHDTYCERRADVALDEDQRRG